MNPLYLFNQLHLIKRSIYILLFVLIPALSFAQGNINFQIGNTLYQQQRFEEALQIYSDLMMEEPEQYIYMEKVVDCLVQLKRYQDGIDVLNIYIDRNSESNLPAIKLAEVYHINGDSLDAYDLWENNLSKYSRSLQVYMRTARSMIERNEFKRAIDVYKRGRDTFNNDELFFVDIANAYMQSGDYENSIREYLNYIKVNPSQIRLFQRTLLRYKDPFVYDIAILEFEDALENISVNDPSYSSLHQILIWMLQENKLYRRAVASAVRYEKETTQVNYALYNLGRELVQNNEFELAVQAFQFYVDTGYPEISWRSKEEVAEVYKRWARYLDDYGLSFDNQSDSLYQKSYDTLNSLRSEAVNYGRMDRVYLSQAELALDFLYLQDEAEYFIKKLKEIASESKSAEISYLEGRMALFNQEYNQARLLFTKSNRAVRIGELAEKSRYYLALTDFFENDFEFAEIQLKTLGRQNTSMYANDALELRLWIQQTKTADSLKSASFAKSYKKAFSGFTNEAKSTLFEIIEDDSNPYADDAFIILSEHIIRSELVAYYISLDSFLNSGTPTPLKERLLWERAKASEYVIDYGNENITEGLNPILLYEQLILDYPQGFYAPFARKRLSELPNVRS